MPWVSIENPSQEMLDKLYQKCLKNSHQLCDDCGVKPGKSHRFGCNTACCSVCQKQLILCECKESKPYIWDGMWPGTKECYEKKYMAKWVGRCSKLIKDGHLVFDFNKLSQENKEKQMSKQKKPTKKSNRKHCSSKKEILCMTNV